MYSLRRGITAIAILVEMTLIFSFLFESPTLACFVALEAGLLGWRGLLNPNHAKIPNVVRIIIESNILACSAAAFCFADGLRVLRQNSPDWSYVPHRIPNLMLLCGVVLVATFIVHAVFLTVFRLVSEMKVPDKTPDDTNSETKPAEESAAMPEKP